MIVAHRMIWVVGGLAGLTFASVVDAGDIVNGWSDVTTVAEIRSQTSLVDFRLNSTVAGCGTPADTQSYWRIAIDSSEASRHRRASLLSAHICENSWVTDFVVLE
jgi:hypothetical protein